MIRKCYLQNLIRHLNMSVMLAGEPKQSMKLIIELPRASC